MQIIFNKGLIAKIYKNSYNMAKKKSKLINSNIGKGLKWTFLQRICTKDQQYVKTDFSISTY